MIGSGENEMLLLREPSALSPWAEFDGARIGTGEDNVVEAVSSAKGSSELQLLR